GRALDHGPGGQRRCHDGVAANIDLQFLSPKPSPPQRPMIVPPETVSIDLTPANRYFCPRPQRTQNHRTVTSGLTAFKRNRKFDTRGPQKPAPSHILGGWTIAETAWRP